MQTQTRPDARRPACLQLWGRRLACAAILLLALMLAAARPATAQPLLPVQSQEETAPPLAQQAIAAKTDSRSDAEIGDRIRSIFSEVAGLRGVEVRVAAGVVTLTGTAPTAAAVGSAAAIAERVAGVVTVQNEVARDLNVDSNLRPVLGDFTDDLRGLVRGLPLIAIATVLALLIGGFGYLAASLEILWKRITPNPFLAELIATLIRFVFVVLGIIAGLQVLGATALLGAVLGGAGVIGIAIGFAVRDTVDNYVSSLMLSLRQPFRANDHVVIEGHEGRVVRLTSRATILMTLEGNHLRIPNSTVFKAVILNFTRNPERRFEFDLGIDSADDPMAGMAVGLQAMRGLPFVLEVPAATAVIHDVGDSSIVLRFYAWIDQARTDFLKGRSLAINASKRALEDAGFDLPEPIYRLRFDQAAPPQTDRLPTRSGTGRRPRGHDPAAADKAPQDATPDSHVAKLVDDERATADVGDLLDNRRPIE